MAKKKEHTDLVLYLGGCCAWVAGWLSFVSLFQQSIPLQNHLVFITSLASMGYGLSLVVMATYEE